MEPGKTRNWGISQWQLCAVSDANKVRAVDEAVEVAGMFKSDWCPELYARADADLERLADWERIIYLQATNGPIVGRAAVAT